MNSTTSSPLLTTACMNGKFTKIMRTQPDLGTKPSQKVPPVPAKGTDRTKNRFVFEKQDLPTQRLLLECFAQKLEENLRREEMTPGGKPRSTFDRSQIMKEVQAATHLTKVLDVRQFDVFLTHIYEKKYLKFPARLDLEAGQQLRQTSLGKVSDITVVAGSDERKFGRASAEAFLDQLYQIADYKLKRFGKEDPQQCLNVGIVSGSTTGATVRACDDLDWREFLRYDVARLPKIRVLALNVCLTTHEHLSGNANILVHIFSEKINKTLREEHRSEAYGLSAPLIVDLAQLQATDQAPQTKDVVQYTEPYRLQKKGEGEPAIKDDETALDIVLTGVGELPIPSKGGGEGGSIFYQLSRQFGFEMDAMVREERIVGDIAFSAIRMGGEWVPLLDKYRKRNAGDSNAGVQSPADSPREWMFYSAVRLPVLEKMAEDRNKRVILVARKAPSKSKEPAIYASVAGNHRYASHLIVDEGTASDLRHGR